MYIRIWYMGININLSFQLEPQNEEGFFISSAVSFFKDTYKDTKCISVRILRELVTRF